jgi:predicted transposase YbfD/YdcC
MSDQEELDAAVRGLWVVFSRIDDDRDRRRITHPLANLLVIATCAILCGIDDIEGIADFAAARRAFFERWLSLPAENPSEATFRRALGMVSPLQLEVAFARWNRPRLLPNDQVLALDGKAVRGSASDEQTQPLYLLHLWATEQKLLLACTAIDGAPAEPSNAALLLKGLRLNGAIVTGDANFAANGVAGAICETGANYCLALKGNRATLHAHVCAFFAGGDACGWENTKVDRWEQTEKGHGRVEHRVVEAIAYDAWPLDETAWPELKTMVRATRTRTIDGQSSTETAYYLSSLEANASRLAKAIRDHWRVENDLHYTLDVYFDEDACQISDRIAAENMSSLRKLTLVMLKKVQDKKSLRGRRTKAALDLAYFETVLRSALVEK